MTEFPERLATKATFLTTQAANHARRLSGKAFERAGARGYHYRILAALSEHGPMSQADLGRSIHMDRSDIVSAVNELAELGQIERRRDDADARRRQVSITDAGGAQLRRLDHELAVAQSDYLAPLTAAESDALRSLLAKLLTHHGSHSR